MLRRQRPEQLHAPGPGRMPRVPARRQDRTAAHRRRTAVRHRGEEHRRRPVRAAAARTPPSTPLRPMRWQVRRASSLRLAQYGARSRSRQAGQTGTERRTGPESRVSRADSSPARQARCSRSAGPAAQKLRPRSVRHPRATSPMGSTRPPTPSRELRIRDATAGGMTALTQAPMRTERQRTTWPTAARADAVHHRPEAEPDDTSP